MSLRRRVEQFSRSEGRTTGPHHHGYSSNLQFGRPTPQLQRLAAANPLFTVDAFFDFVASDNSSSARFMMYPASRP
ncbi:hypothetical protein AMECASPLE_039300 [Ameca splendens]|uniref:Uncharacterized protein n=1 Tax=Ameca splendens TaxID=208324 RepID=A0ABV0ZJ86_9TELE